MADTGPGIPGSEREAVFEAGYSTDEGGTGFGLRTVRQVAQAHGWAVTVTESDQGGARFEITGVELDGRWWAGQTPDTALADPAVSPAVRATGRRRHGVAGTAALSGAKTGTGE